MFVLKLVVLSSVAFSLVVCDLNQTNYGGKNLSKLEIVTDGSQSLQNVNHTDNESKGPILEIPLKMDSSKQRKLAKRSGKGEREMDIVGAKKKKKKPGKKKNKKKKGKKHNKKNKDKDQRGHCVERYGLNKQQFGYLFKG